MVIINTLVKFTIKIYSMEESTREMERRTGEETEVVNYADHHHGMWRRVTMCWDKDEEREENDS